MDSDAELTKLFIAIGIALLIFLHPLVLLLIQKKRAKIKNIISIYSGLIFSLIGGSIFVIFWFKSSEYAGPIGRGLFVFISPITTLIAMVILFALGASICEMGYLLYGLLVKKQKLSILKTCIVAIVLVVSFFMVYRFVAAVIPDDYGLQAVPEENFTNGIGMDMIKVSAGYWVGKYEVTQAQFEKIMGFNPSSHTKVTAQLYQSQQWSRNEPVTMITDSNAMEFCKKLSEFEEKQGVLPKGYIYSLPTEKQWREYVADTKLEDAVIPAFHKSKGHPNEVGSLKPNRLGLYDVRGNVYELCLETERVMHINYRRTRGGSFNTHQKEYWPIDSSRSGLPIGKGSLDTGFRVVLVKEERK